MLIFFCAVFMFVFCQMTSYVACTILSLGHLFDPLIDYAAGDVADVKAAWPHPMSDVHLCDGAKLSWNHSYPMASFSDILNIERA